MNYSLPIKHYLNNDLQDITGEEWSDVPGYEGFYMASSFGRVKSLFRWTRAKLGSKRSVKERILKSATNRDGYLTVVFCKGNREMDSWTVHRAVALSFKVPNPENKPEINHKNGFKWDCSLSNLEWATESENGIHSRDLGLNTGRGETHFKAKLNDKQVLEIFESNENNSVLADKFSVSKDTISGIKRGKSWRHITGIKRIKTKNILKKDQILMIINTNSSNEELAKRFGVQPKCIKSIREGKRWTSITGIKKK